MQSLKSSRNELAIPLNQLRVLNNFGGQIPRFQEKLEEAGLYPLTPTRINILQINLGKMCNQTCTHCHVDAGPDRDEIMTRDTMRECLAAIRNTSIETVDLTGGAPELNPNFRWFVREIRKLCAKVLVRSNLTILTVNSKRRELPGFFAESKVTVISSLPCYTEENTDRQRGSGVFSKSLEALRMLNAEGYGKEGTGLELNLVYNPGGPFLPGPQKKLTEDYKRILFEEYGIVFNELYCITNMPISRFLDSLINSNQYPAYMEKLVNAFNPSAASGVMCRNTLSVGWDGTLYDCDFNQMLEIQVNSGSQEHISNFSLKDLEERQIALGQHCFGCTAGAGSSCGGEIVE